jgi:hypothetical protein
MDYKLKTDGIDFIYMIKEIEKIEEQIKEIIEKMNDPELCFGTASTMTRVTGYYRPVEMFCYGKRQEYLERAEYQPFEKHSNDKQWIVKLLHSENGIA